MNKEMKLSEYLNKSKKIQVDKFTKKIRIAVLSSFTVNGLAETLRVKCAENKINGLTYTAEYNTNIDAWYKSVSGGEVTSSLWVIPESTMEKAYDDCVTAGFLTYEVAENKTCHGRPYRKLIVTFK